MKRIYIVGLLLGLFAVSGFSQSIPFQSEWQGRERVTLHFELSVPDSLAHSKYAVWVMPFVHNGQGDTLTLTPVVFRGKQNKKYVDRARFYDDAPAASCDELSFGEAKSYSVTLPTAATPWLTEGRMEVEAKMEKEGCCNVFCLPQKHYGHFAYIPPFEPELVAVEENTSKAAVWQHTNPVLAHISDYRPYDRTRILRKEKGMLYVYHPFDKDDLLRDFRQNAPVLDKIVAMTRDIMKDTTSTVKLIQIVGMASIEGPVKHNEDLAIRRAESMKRYIQDRVDIPDSLFELNNGGEGWTEFRDQINDTTFEGRDEMLAIIDNTADVQQREYKLKHLMGGKPYRIVRDNILRDQRNSGYLRVYFDYVPDAAAKAINHASELLNQGAYAEALKVLEPVREDARAWNTLGVALYMGGQQEAGIRYIRRAAAQGNPDAQRNLEQFDAIEKAKKAAK